ncbi:hypothetical protein B0H13DRAFT_2430598 [Mycena leptocephala]|nr:hypothetical protein B0H13DRAFT_2430598 [Mycena leptocephala]
MYDSLLVHWILTVIHFFRGFLGTPDIGSAHEYFAHDQTMTQVIRSALGDITLLIGDAVIIHRLWLIWNRNLRVIVLPVLSWLGMLACAITIAYLFHAPLRDMTFLFGSEGACQQPTGTSVYSTAFIAWKSVLAILVESAAIWTHLPNMRVSAWVIFFAVSYQTGSILQYLTAQLTPPIIGLFNMFIHLRVGSGDHTRRARQVHGGDDEQRVYFSGDHPSVEQITVFVSNPTERNIFFSFSRSQLEKFDQGVPHPFYSPLVPESAPVPKSARAYRVLVSQALNSSSGTTAPNLSVRAKCGRKEFISG